MTTSTTTRLLLVGLVLATTACTSRAEPSPPPTPTPPAAAAQVVQAGAPGEQPIPLSPDHVNDLAPPAHTAGDVAFVRDMLHHHAQALEMTALAEDHAGSDRIRLMAERMTISQESESELMLRWLADRDEDAPAHHAGMDHDMPGILTPEQMADLAAAEGTDFDLLFLQSMTHHHDGALQMVEDLYGREDGSGEDLEIQQLAFHIDADQRMEMDRMAQLHAELVSND
ncbi:DUF305 domain-containing protein [Salsipaludibacter albus]|uniref:DUF305 domain-containing protein n=1 Tax=Salsipaludibacter albus TaxID=2849650 RepID=UPI001EE44D9C|nr:DUF305 domain-containing protein [Salsipaludibacter albus]MBY5164140.1 DUF305 domain-containing protein [Salsipaludibacter albus]